MNNDSSAGDTNDALVEEGRNVRRLDRGWPGHGAVSACSTRAKAQMSTRDKYKKSGVAQKIVPRSRWWSCGRVVVGDPTECGLEATPQCGRGVNLWLGNRLAMASNLIAMEEGTANKFYSLGSPDGCAFAPVLLRPPNGFAVGRAVFRRIVEGCPPRVNPVMRSEC